MLSILFVGFLLGMRHAFEADHFAAIASLAGCGWSLKKAFRLGAIWGLGHTLTLFIVVSLVLLMNSDVPVRLTQILEMMVGIMLILLGIDVLFRLIKNKVRVHVHSHDGSERQHIHAQSFKKDSRYSIHNHDNNPQMFWRALTIGLVHGLAGSATLVVLTVAATDSLWLGMIYTAVFGMGSILGMAALSMTIAVPIGIWGHRLTGARSTIMAIIGLVSITIGGNLFFSNAVNSGFFT